jgi:hypothetical protein
MKVSEATMAHTRLYGIIGCLAALAAVVADLALQYTTNPAHLGALDYSYFLDVSPSRIRIGFFLGVIAILLEIAGLWYVAQGLAPAGKRFWLPFFLLSAFITALGTVFHAHAAFLGLVVKAQAQSPESIQGFTRLIAELVAYRTALISTLFIGQVVFALWYAFVVAFKKTAYPRYAALFNPLFLLILFAMLGIIVPPLRFVLLPAGINLANFLFFTLAMLMKQHDTSYTLPVSA